MQRLEVSGVVRLIYRSLGVKGLRRSLLNGVSDLEIAVTVLEAIVSATIGTVLMFEWSFVKS